MRTSNSIIMAVQSGSAAVRLREARRFLERFEPGAEVLLLGGSRGSVDDLARAISIERGATFGLHRLSFTQLAARLALMELASRERAPTTTLGHEAVATRAAFEARSDEALEYFSPVSQTPGFPKALARTLLELRLAAVAGADLVRLPRSGTDLAALLDRVDILLNEAGASDRAALFETATKALGSPVIGWPPMPLLLLDVLFESEIEAQFLWALVQQSPQVMITVPAGDASALSQLEKRGVRVQVIEEAEQNDLTQLARYLFSKEPPPERTRTGELVWFSARGDVFGVLSERAPDEPDGSDGDGDQRPATNVNGDQAVVAGTLRAPWKWESLLVESAVIGGSERWARRLNGLAAEYELKIRELTSEQPDSPRIARLERERQNLAHLRGFALPLIEEMSAWPKQATWGDWSQRLEELAPRVLRRPEFVLRVLADLRPMAAVGPVSLAEVRDVLADRLAALEVEPPAYRYGRVFVCSAEQVRGRVFRVAFVPGLAERLFPQKVREDPLLLDALKREIGGELTLQEDRAEHERLLLRLAVGVATE